MPAITKIQQRRGTSSQWSTANPVLSAGEIGVDTTLGNLKIGDGVNTWANLPFLPLSTSARAEMWDKSATQVADKAPPTDPVGTKLTKVGMVLPLSAGSTYDNLKVESLTTLLDPESGRIAGVYTGYGNVTGVERGSVCLAYSDDGINWEKQGVTLGYSNTAGALDQNGCTGPLLIFDNGTYYLFYIGLTGTGYEAGTKTLMLATSPTLKNATWTRLGAIMSAGGTGWRAQQIWHPSVVRHNGKWYCFMNASGNDGYERIGYATADQLTGPWTFDDVNSPLLQTVGHEIIGDPCVTKIQGGWRMDYFTAPSGTAMDWYTTTTDALFPLGWKAHDAADTTRQTVTPGPSGTYDSIYAHKPFIMYYAGRTYHYYTAVDDAGNRQVGLAIGGPDIPFKGDVLVGVAPISVAKFCSIKSNFADIITTSAYAESALARCKVQAKAGDTIEVTVHLVANNGAGDLRVDACPIVGGARASYISGLGSAGNGVTAWGAIGGNYAHAGGTYHYRLSANEIEKGVCTLALVFKNSGSARNIFASTDPIIFAVHNLGQ